MQKLTELSVDRIVVLRTERSVVRWEGDRADHHLERLRRIAREAAMQSRQVWLPEIVGRRRPARTTRAPRWPTPAGGHRRWATPSSCAVPRGAGATENVVRGRSRVTLGPAVLRAETAAVTAGALLVALRHGLVRPA